MMPGMRTTITLDPDVADLVRKVMRERGISFKEAVNEAIRAGLGGRRRARFQTPTFSMGFEPTVPWPKAVRLLGELEDEELVRKLATRK
jgi:hypothetical protein